MNGPRQRLGWGRPDYAHLRRILTHPTYAKRTLSAFGHVVEDFVEVLRPFPGILTEIAAEIEGVDSEPDDSTLATA